MTLPWDAQFGQFPLLTDCRTRSARFNADRTCRFELRRWWVQDPQLWAAWLMHNPSDANEAREDPTSRRVIEFSKAAGCDGLVVVNLWPYVSSSPAEAVSMARLAFALYEDDALKDNLQVVEAAGRQATRRFVAFGNGGSTDEPWLERVLEAYTQPPDRGAADERLWCVARTKHGWPTHPMARGKHRILRYAPMVWSRP